MYNKPTVPRALCCCRAATGLNIRTNYYTCQYQPYYMRHLYFIKQNRRKQNNEQYYRKYNNRITEWQLKIQIG
jgi:hypothetical protein